MLTVLRHDVDAHWISQASPCECIHCLCLCCTEEACSSLSRQPPHDGVELCLKTHVQQPICLIKHQDLHCNEPGQGGSVASSAAFGWEWSSKYHDKKTRTIPVRKSMDALRCIISFKRPGVPISTCPPNSWNVRTSAETSLHATCKNGLSSLCWQMLRMTQV
jgi:hypothetical protein